ncbi:hypothetical protein Tco_1548968 [Tanacetum coccineum]
MNYQPVRSENQANKHAGPQEANPNACIEDNIDAVKSSKANNAGEEPTKHPDFQQIDKEDQERSYLRKLGICSSKARAAKASSTNIVNTASTPVSTASLYSGLSFTDLTNTDQDDSEIHALEEIYNNPAIGRTAAIQDSESLDSCRFALWEEGIGYITAKVAGKPVSIFEASIRSDLLFDDAVFESKSVIFRMVKKGKLIFQGQSHTLFSEQCWFNQTEDEGVNTIRTSILKPLLTPSSSPSPRSVSVRNPGVHLSRVIYSLSGECEGDMTLQVYMILLLSLCVTHDYRTSRRKIKHLKAQIKKLKKKAKPVITHHRAWMKSVSLKQRLAGKKSLKKSVDAIGSLYPNREGNTCQNRRKPLIMSSMSRYVVGEDRNVVYEEKESAEDAVSTEDVVSADKEKVSTDRSKDSTDKEKDSTDKEKDSTDRPDEGTDDQTKGRSATPTTPTPTPTTFGDDETISQVLLNMSQAKAVSREKEKGVELKDIDPKDKGKKKIEEDESDTKSEDINETEKKFKMLAHDEEIARKMQEDWETKEERKRLAEEEAINAALIQDFDDIKVRMEADRLLALRLQEEEREQFTMEERAKFLHDTIAAQRRNKKHSDLKNKTFEEIQALYKKVKRFDESFTAVGSTKDERKIKEMNEEAKDLEHKGLKKKVAKETPKKEDTAKVPAEVDVTEQGIKKRKGGHMKMLARKGKKTKSDVSSPDGDYLVIYRTNGNFRAFNYLLEVLHIFDRQDLFHLYELVMKQYLEMTMEGIELILWGDLKIMMESSKEENDQKLEDGTIIHMLVERRYPLSKDLMQTMLDFRLEVEIESTIALDLIRFIKQQIGEE